MNDGIFDESTTARRRIGSEAEIAEIRRLYSQGEIGAALGLAGLVRVRDEIPMTAIPVVTVTRDALMKLPLDHRAGFMLTRIDGTSNVQAVLDVSAMPREEGLALLEKLETLGALSFESDEDEPTIRRSTTPPKN